MLWYASTRDCLIKPLFLLCISIAESRYWGRVGFVLKASLLIFILILDPFHITTATDKASSDILNRVNAVKYPDTGQNDVTVVFIDDAFLNSRNLHWPLSYAEQSVIFRQILRYKPKALFIDFLYTHDRSDSDDNVAPLLNVFERYHARTPIYVPLADETEFEPSTFFKHVTPVKVQWDGKEHYYPPRVDGLPTPAFAIYQQHCEDAGESNCMELADEPPPVYVQWGAKLSALQDKLTDNTHCTDVESFAVTAGKVTLSEIFWKLVPSWRQNCPYTTTIPASHLAARDKNDIAVLEDAIAGKTIMVGALIQGARDEVYSPVHGLIAGVYLHAMAFDNLQTYQQGYFRPSPEIIGNVDIADITDCLFFMLVFFWRERVNQLTGSGQSAGCEQSVDRQQLKAIGRSALLIMLALLVVVLVFSFVLNYQPINWVAQLILILTILAVQIRLIEPLRKATSYLKERL